MTVQELIRDMRRHTGGAGMITVAEFAAFMAQTNHDRVKKKYLIGLEAVDGKYYYIPDVARAIYERREIT